MVPGHEISSRATSNKPPDLVSSTTLGCKIVKLAKVLLLNVDMNAFDTSVKVQEEDSCSTNSAHTSRYFTNSES